MVSQAETIRNSINTNWGLTGQLSKTETNSMKEVIRFFDREQVKGNEWPKAITVVKINDEADENRIEHPVFTEVSDNYVITCHYRVVDVEPTTYSTALTAVEDMGREVQRILKLTYQPSSITGDFMTTSNEWRKLDHLDGAQPELIRALYFKLTKIISEEPTVFTGYGGVLTFDTSASVGINKPVGDYIYTESHRVRIQEGYGTLPYFTKDKSLGANGGVPHLRRGIFRGVFNATIFAKKADIAEFGTDEKLNRLYRIQLTGQHLLAVFLHAHSSLESSPSTLTQQTFVKVTSMEKLTDNEQLVSFDVTGDLIKPSVYQVAP